MSAKEGKVTENTNGFKWSEDAAKTAQTNHTFIKVGGTKVAPRVLAGSVRGWNSNKDTDRDLLFVLSHRIAGTEENIRKALTLAQLSKVDIDKAVKSAISSQNYRNTDKKELIDEEHKNRTQNRGILTEDKELWEKINHFAQQRKSKTFRLVPRKNTGEAAAKRAATGGKPKGNRKTLKEALNGVVDGKVIDVSGLDTKTGWGYNTILKPKDSPKSGKYGVDEIPLVSNNEKTFIAALRFIYEDDDDKVAELSKEYKEKVSEARKAIAEKARGGRKKKEEGSEPETKPKKVAANKPAATEKKPRAAAKGKKAAPAKGKKAAEPTEKKPRKVQKKNIKSVETIKN
jgi:hypothetical protein